MDVFSGTYQLIVIAVSLTGLAAGVIGAFVFFRKETLLTDVASHASLPGLLIGFIVSSTTFSQSKNSVGLLVGATISATAAIGITRWVVNNTRLKPDAVMAIMLSTFFGFGMILLRHINNGDFPKKGGIGNYLTGNASTITKFDAQLSMVVGIVTVLVILMNWKTVKSLSFDRQFSYLAQNRSRLIDFTVLSMMVVITVVGIKAFGLVLTIALFVAPAGSAKQFVSHFGHLVLTSGLIGAIGAGVGVAVSFHFDGLPTGPAVVLTLFSIALLAMLFSPRTGMLINLIRSYRSEKRGRSLRRLI